MGFVCDWRSFDNKPENRYSNHDVVDNVVSLIQSDNDFSVTNQIYKSIYYLLVMQNSWH